MAKAVASHALGDDSQEMDQCSPVWKKLYQSPDASLIGALVRTKPPRILGGKIIGELSGAYVGAVEDVRDGCLTIDFRDKEIGKVTLPRKHNIELREELTSQEFGEWQQRQEAIKHRREETVQSIIAVCAEGPHPLPEAKQALLSKILSSFTQQLADGDAIDLFATEARDMVESALEEGRCQFAKHAVAARLQAAKDEALVKVRAYGRDELNNDLTAEAVDACVRGDVEKLRAVAAGCFGTFVARPTGAWAAYQHQGFDYGSAHFTMRDLQIRLPEIGNTGPHLWGDGDTLLGLASRAAALDSHAPRALAHRMWPTVIEALREIGVPEEWAPVETIVFLFHSCIDDGSAILHTDSGTEVRVPNIADGTLSDLMRRLKQVLWLSRSRHDLRVQIVAQDQSVYNEGGPDCQAEIPVASLA